VVKIRAATKDAGAGAVQGLKEDCQAVNAGRLMVRRARAAGCGQFPLSAQRIRLSKAALAAAVSCGFLSIGWVYNRTGLLMRRSGCGRSKPRSVSRGVCRFLSPVESLPVSYILRVYGSKGHFQVFRDWPSN